MLIMILQKVGLVVLESGKKKVSIRDALATSYIVQHRNKKNFLLMSAFIKLHMQHPTAPNYIS